MKKWGSAVRKESELKVVKYMAMFMALYIPLLLLVVALGVGSVWWYVDKMRSLPLGEMPWPLVLVFGILMLWVLYAFVIIPALKGLLSPLFVTLDGGVDKRVTANKSNAPELVSLVNELARRAGIKKPCEIYLTSDCQASMHIKGSMLRFFLPLRYSLSIGVGMFRNMSRNEVAACIAHEIGHYAGKNHRIMHAVFFAYESISRIVYYNDNWKNTVNNLINMPWPDGPADVLCVICRGFGWLLYGLTVGYTNAVESVFKKLQLAQLVLCRELEYEADDFAARILGSNTFRSFACKLIEAVQRHQSFDFMLSRLASDNKMPANYWEAYNDTDRYISEHSGINLEPATPYFDNVLENKYRRLTFDDIYVTHPDWSDRLQAVADSHYPDTDLFPGAAGELVRSVRGLDILGNNECNDYVQQYSDPDKPIDHLDRQQMDSVIDEYNFWCRLSPYIMCHVAEFDYESCVPHKSTVLNDKQYLEPIEACDAAYTDYLSACIIHDIPFFTNVCYNGSQYEPSQLPLDEIKAVLDTRKREATVVARMICEQAMANSGNIDAVKLACKRLFYAQNCVYSYDRHVYKLLSDSLNILHKKYSRDDNNSLQQKAIKASISEVNRRMTEHVLDKIDTQLLAYVADDEELAFVNWYIKRTKTLTDNSFVGGGTIYNVFMACDLISNLHRRMVYKAQKAIVAACFGRSIDE